MTTEELLIAIVDFDCQPTVFQAHVIKASYQSGFTVEVEFRTTVPGAISSFEAHDDNLHLAAEKAYFHLRDKFSKCTECGQYRHEAQP